MWIIVVKLLMFNIIKFDGSNVRGQWERSIRNVTHSVERPLYVSANCSLTPCPSHHSLKHKINALFFIRSFGGLGDDGGHIVSL